MRWATSTTPLSTAKVWWQVPNEMGNQYNDVLCALSCIMRWAISTTTLTTVIVWWQVPNEMGNQYNDVLCAFMWLQLPNEMGNQYNATEHCNCVVAGA